MVVVYDGRFVWLAFGSFSRRDLLGLSLRSYGCSCLLFVDDDVDLLIILVVVYVRDDVVMML